MDTYPADLLTGGSVRPLIFAVDAILRTTAADEADPHATSAHFDRFLEAVVGSGSGADNGAAVLPDAGAGGAAAAAVGGDGAVSTTAAPPPPPPPPPPPTSHRSGSGSIISPTQTLQKFTQKLHLTTHSTSSGTSGGSGDDGDGEAVEVEASLLNPDPYSIDSTDSNNASSSAAAATSAAAAQRAMQFFRSANVVPVSSRHAFPPSRDPDGVGTKDLTFALSASGGGALVGGGVDGILPTGWLEKHLHALPSALMVVTLIDLNQAGLSQGVTNAQDECAIETVSALRMSLAAKRECKIHLVCLVVNCDDERQQQEQQEGEGGKTKKVKASREEMDRVGNLMKKCRLNAGSMSILRPSDLITDDSFAGAPAGAAKLLPPSKALTELRKSVRASSVAYYTNQVRRAKRKLQGLGADLSSRRPDLLPLAARYCLKVGVFSELASHAAGGAGAGGSGGGTDTGLGHMGEAYWNVESYYAFLCRQLEGAGGRGQPQRQQQAVQSQQQQTVQVVVAHDEEEGVEIGLTADPPPTTTMATADSNNVEEGQQQAQTQQQQQQPGAPPPPPPPPPQQLVSESSSPPAHPEPSAPPPSSGNVPLATLGETDGAGTTGGYVDPTLLDLLHQCRTLSSVLNLKLLNAALAAGRPETAAAQWRRHSGAFLGRPPCATAIDGNAGNAAGSSGDGAVAAIPPWHHWSYVSGQRVAAARLMERYGGSRSSSQYGVGFGAAATSASSATAEEHETRTMLSPWRAYQSAAEATAKLGVVVGRERAAGGDHGVSGVRGGGGGGEDRQRFVGGLSSSALGEAFDLEVARDHSALALECATKALALYEAESENDASSDTVSRRTARLRYLLGGILFTMDRYDESAVHLNRAASAAVKWPGLEVTIQRALLRCLERRTTTVVTDAGGGGVPDRRDVALAMVLSTGTASLMNPGEVDDLSSQAFLGSSCGTTPMPARSSDVKMIDWPVLDNSTAPFEFAATFPGTTHATSGDVVQAVVSVRSRLRFPVRLGSGKLRTTIGDIDIPQLASGSGRTGDDPVLIEAGSVHSWSVQIPLPVEMQPYERTPVGGKAAEKKIKPKTAGMTRAAGACYTGKLTASVARTEGTSKNAGGVNDKASDVNAYLGGIAVSCRGIELELRHADGGGTGGRSVFLTISDRGRASSATHVDKSKKTTPVEEENYVMSTWERPRFHPYALGPRCLRVHGPIPNVEVTNVTAVRTKRKVMEGTVNRILLQVKAGEKEFCRDMKFSVTCTSALGYTEETADGPMPPPLVDKESKPDVSSTPKRLPMLVEQDLSMSGTAIVTDEGYTLPPGWKPSGDESGQGSTDATTSVTANLEPGKCTLLSFDLFRPMPLLPTIGSASLRSPDAERDTGELSCWTHFEVKITYRQSRPNRRTDADGESSTEGGDPVTRGYSGSVVWCSPISAQFSVVGGSQKAYPSGCRHPSNLVPESAAGSAPGSKSSFGAESLDSFGSVDGGGEAIAVDGEEIRVRCTLQADEAKDGLAAEVQKVSFQTFDSERRGNEELKCDLSLVSSGHSSVLYSKKSGDVCHLLRKGSRFGLSYCVKAKLNSSEENGVGDENDSLRTSLGVLAIEWAPISLPAIEGTVHGPLPLLSPSTSKFFGPVCYIENAPFEAKLTAFPTAPRVAIPFEVKYCITNKTPFNQKLSLSMSEASLGEAAISDASDTVLVSGLVNGEVHLAPSESRTLRYSALAIRAGKTPMPALTVSSVRHKSWVINDGPTNPRYFFVLP